MYITDRAYTESQIREMEIKILAALGKIFKCRPRFSNLHLFFSYPDITF